MAEKVKIRCPKCRKILGEWQKDHINIKRIKLLVYGATAMPRECPGCGELLDMIKEANGAKKT